MIGDEQGLPPAHHRSLFTVHRGSVNAFADFGRQRALVARAVEGGDGEIIRLANREAGDRVIVGAADDDWRARKAVNTGCGPYIDFVSCQVRLAVQRPTERGVSGTT